MRAALAAFFACVLSTIATAGEIRLIVPTAPGGNYDHIARVVARHLSRYLPDKPYVLVENRPAASGRAAANYLFNQAPRDGSVIGLMQQQVTLWQVLGDEHAHYDAKRFTWIGALSIDEVLAVHAQSGIKTIEDARHSVVRLGANGKLGAGYVYPKLANDFLGTLFSVVPGYGGFPQIKLAIEHGEVDGLGSYPWSSWKAERPDWVAAGKIIPLFQMGLHKHEGLENVPRMLDLAKTPQAHDVLEAMTIVSDLSRPFAAPPGVPQEKIDLLRKAFDEMAQDPLVVEEASRAHFKINPVPGLQVTRLVHQMFKVAPTAILLLKTAMKD